MPLRRNRVLRKALATKKRAAKPVVNSVKNTLPKSKKDVKTKTSKHAKDDDATEFPEVDESGSVSEYSDDKSEDIKEYNTRKKNPIPEDIEVKVPKMNDMIRARYSELLKELWENENQLNELKLNATTRNLLNCRSKLWLEYFISTYTSKFL